MLTARGWSFLLVVLLMLAGGLFARVAALTILSLTLVVWFVGEFVVFASRAQSLHRRLRVTREVRDDRGAVTTLWAGREFEVRVRLGSDGWLSLPYVSAADRVPFGVDHLSGLSRAEGPVGAGAELVLRYRVRCGDPGTARFEGVRVQTADYQGFFYTAAFVPGVAVMRVLPRLSDAEGLSPASKRLNLLPPPGVHRLRYPGSGSELLDLRDYLPGDPPRTIAWKVSARRDRLITKAFESEVPVRCTLFVDTSGSVRVGSAGGRALTRLVEIAAAVLQANAAVRDLTGVCLFDEHGVTAARPDRSPAHLRRMLRLLADASALEPSCARTDPEELVALAYGFAFEVYPELLRPAVNRVPWWLKWLRSFPGYWRRSGRMFRYLYRRRLKFFFLGGTALPLLFLLVNLFFVCLAPTGVAVLVVYVTSALAALAAAGGLLLFLASTVLGGRQRRLAANRKRMAALLSVRYGLAPGGLEALLEDDDQLSLLLQRFLTEHRVPFSLPLYDRKGRYLFAAPEKVGVLAGALVRAVGKGHDNELFVLLADLLELDDRLDPLLRAVRLAMSRKHQVMLVCPWPPGVELPRGVGTGRPRSAAPGRPAHEPPEGHIGRDVKQTTAERFHAAYARVRRAFGRLGVPVVCAAGDDPVPLILQRLDRLRSPGRNR
jgi:uncharacterized protein (DUF58 family)